MFLHHPVDSHAVKLASTSLTDVIETTIVLRRRLDHAPIPSFAPRTFQKRLSNEEFAVKYGASDEDIEAVIDYYTQFGLTVTLRHSARRHVAFSGTVAQHNNAFGAQLHNWEKSHGESVVQFRASSDIPVIPEHLQEVIHKLCNFDTEPRYLPPVTPQPVQPPNTTSLSPAQLMLLYNTPTNKATGQTVATVSFTGWGDYTTDALNTTLSAYNIPTPTVSTIVVDSGATLGAGGETSLDVTMVAIFGQGADIVVYNGNTFDTVIGRIVAPDVGDAAIDIVSCSACTAVDLFDNSLVWEDAAIQGITIFASAGDWGTTGDFWFGSSVSTTTVCFPASHPYVCGVGGTIIGNVSTPITASSTFDEWLWSDGVGGTGGGGVSNQYVQPPYQSNVTVPTSQSGTPVSLIGTSAGRGVPDISALASPASGFLFYAPVNGVTMLYGYCGGTSSSCPLVAGTLARINASIGSNVGFINPTLYAVGSGSTSIRDINLSGSGKGGASTNGNYGGGGSAGYSVTTGWDACTGLGVINGGNLLAYLKNNPISQQEYYIQIQATNAVGAAPMSATFGPFVVQT